MSKVSFPNTFVPLIGQMEQVVPCSGLRRDWRLALKMPLVQFRQLS